MSIHLGGSDDLQDIRLGVDGLQFVYLGDNLIWQNNAGPALSNVTLNGVAIGDNSDQSLLRNTAYTLSSTITDLEMDAPYKARLLKNGTQVGDDIENLNEGDSFTFTIPQSEYTGGNEVGEVDPPDVWTVETEDNLGTDNDFSFNVTELDFTAPNFTTGVVGTQVGSNASYTFSYSASNSTSGINLATTVFQDNSALSNLSGNVTISAACGGTATTTLSASTVGGGLTRSSAARTVTYSRTAASTTTTCGAYGACTANAPNTCAPTLQTCTASGTRTRACTTTGFRICDNATLSQQNFNQSIGCSDSNPNQHYINIANIAVTCETGIFAPNTLTCSVSGDVAAPSGYVKTYSWEVLTGDGTISGSNSGSSVEIGNSVAASGDVRVTVTYTSSSFTRTGTADGSYELQDNNFGPADAGFSVQDGIVGNPTVASVTNGTLVSVSPNVYAMGTTTYNGVVTVPLNEGWTNEGENINVSAMATGTNTITIANGFISNQGSGTIINVTQNTGFGPAPVISGDFDGWFEHDPITNSSTFLGIGSSSVNAGCARVVNLTVTKGSASDSFTVTQAETAPALTVTSTGTTNVSPEGGSNLATWVITESGCGDLAVSGSNGATCAITTGVQTLLNMSVSANNTPDSRTPTCTVSKVEGGVTRLSRTASVNQDSNLPVIQPCSINTSNVSVTTTNDDKTMATFSGVFTPSVAVSKPAPVGGFSWNVPGRGSTTQACTSNDPDIVITSQPNANAAPGTNIFSGNTTGGGLGIISTSEGQNRGIATCSKASCDNFDYSNAITCTTTIILNGYTVGNVSITGTATCTG